MSNSKLVTVVIPTFNRGHLLEKVIPTYFQDCVDVVVVINDNSIDNTRSVLEMLSEKFENLVVINNKKNIKQTGCKNIGIELAKTDYIYFGDDDSYITPGSISKLLDVVKINKCEIASARALYFNNETSEAELFERYNRRASSSLDLVDLNTMKINFTLLVDFSLEVPISQSCFLIKTDLAKKVKFSKLFIGNCYREESDFLLRCNAKGARNFYTSSSCQINLPRKLASGGAHDANKIMRRIYTQINDLIFVIKNYCHLAKLTGGNINPLKLLLIPYFNAPLKLYKKYYGSNENNNYS